MSGRVGELGKAGWLGGVFLLLYFLPVGWPRFEMGVAGGLALAHGYAREHVVLCLVPAFLLAGAIGVFVRREAVLRWLGPDAPRPVAYGLAAASGGVLSVCSCTVLPLFAGIWRMGAGLGPAVAFLYAGPAISVLAVVLTARVLGWELGLARMAGAMIFAVVIGVVMARLFREDARRGEVAGGGSAGPGRPAWQTLCWLGGMVAVLVFANWSEAGGPGARPVWMFSKWVPTSLAAMVLAGAMAGWFGARWWKVCAGAAATAAAAVLARGHAELPFAVGCAAVVWIAATTPGELREWAEASWEFAKLIAPMLLAGVFLAGFLLGGPGGEGLIPAEAVRAAVGGNGLPAALLSSAAGALMYFATLTEIPVLQGLLANGMGKGPALALLLAGPALSLPNMLALGRIMGARRTFAYCLLVVGMSALAGWLYGFIA